MIANLVSEVREQKKKLDELLLQNPQQHIADEVGELEQNAVLGKLPLDSIEDFQVIEENLKDARTFKLLVKALISLGGRDLKTFIYNTLRRILTNQLAMKFSFSGKQPKEKEKKMAFSSTLLYKSIQAAVKKVYADAKEDLIKTHVSHWLQQAKHRVERREANKESSNEEGGSGNNIIILSHWL